MQYRNRRVRTAFAALAMGSLAILPLAGCVRHHHHYHCPEAAVPAAMVGGPPVTLAHGAEYHYHDHDVTLVFDADWGGYWVRDYRDHYYYGGYYYRHYAGRWHRADRPHGRWVVVKVGSLPGRLDRHCDRIARHEAQESWRDATRARREAQREREEHHRDAREERHDAKQEQREERQEIRDERHEANQDRRDDRPDAREERHEARQEQREERQKEAPQREERRERRGGKPKQSSVPASQSESDSPDDNGSRD